MVQVGLRRGYLRRKIPALGNAELWGDTPLRRLRDFRSPKFCCLLLKVLLSSVATRLASTRLLSYRGLQLPKFHSRFSFRKLAVFFGQFHQITSTNNVTRQHLETFLQGGTWTSNLVRFVEFFPGTKDVFVSFDLLVVRRRIGYTFYQELFPFFLGVDLMVSRPRTGIRARDEVDEW